jgi:hypothetical protein
MRRIVAKATYECISAIETMDNINNARGHLTGEVRKLGSQAVDHKEDQQGLWDGLAEAPQIRGVAADLGAVLDDSFSGQHTSLKKPSEDQYQASAGRGMMHRDQVVQHEDTLICKRGGATLNVWFEHITIQTVDQEHIQLGREKLICELLSVLGGNAIPELGMEDGSDLE